MTTTKFIVGEKVVWLKRVPGGDYVYPVSAVVVALTAKRVKIKADDDGQIVVRFVPAESLQKGKLDLPANERIGIGRLKGVSVLYEGDFYDLALFLLKMNDAKDKGTNGRSRHTVYGVASVYSMIADMPRDKITRLVEQHGLPLNATVEYDKDA